MPSRQHQNWLLAALSLSLINIPAGSDAAYNFSVINKAPITTPGGSRYSNEIGGDEYSSFAMSEAADVVVSVLGFYDPKPVTQISLIIEEDDIGHAGNEGCAYYSNGSNNIHVSGRYLGDYEGADVRKEFSGMIHHCMTLVWLWNGDGQAPAGLLTGIASFVRAYAGLTPAAGSKTTTTTRFGDGERWDQGHEVTANFLIYCEALRHRFVPELNGKLKYGYADGLFHDLTGKTVAELWKDYKTEFGTRLISNTVTDNNNNNNNNNEISY